MLVVQVMYLIQAGSTAPAREGGNAPAMEEVVEQGMGAMVKFRQD